MKWLKAAIVGALGSLVMFIILMITIEVIGVAPINQPPSAAFLQVLGLIVLPLPLIVHFLYGMFWSIILVALSKTNGTIMQGLGLSILLWLGLMVIFSPIIGWGFFGFGGDNHTLEPDDPLYIGNSIKFVVMTLVVHLIYGLIIGWLNPLWIKAESGQETKQKQEETVTEGG